MSLWGSVPFLQELWLLISLPQALLEVTDQRGLNQPSFPGQSHPTGFSCQACSREADGNFLRLFRVDLTERKRKWFWKWFIQPNTPLKICSSCNCTGSSCGRVIAKNSGVEERHFWEDSQRESRFVLTGTRRSKSCNQSPDREFLVAVRDHFLNSRKGTFRNGQACRFSTISV